MAFTNTGNTGMYPGPVVTTPEVRDKLAALSVDEPLPENYNRDTIRLLLQSPRRIFAHWEFARDPHEALTRLFGNQSHRFRLAIRLLDLDSGHISIFDAPPSRNYWFNVSPGRRYTVEVGFQGSEGAFIRLFGAEQIKTPRGRVSPETDPNPAFRVNSGQFAQILERAGYVADAIEVVLEAADERPGGMASLEFVSRVLGEEIRDLPDVEMNELRGAIAAFALGASVGEVADQVSDHFATWLREHFGAHEFSPELILRVLREMFGISFEFDVKEFEEARRRMQAARIVVGASEIHMPGIPLRMWMPSMTPGGKTKL